MQLLCYEIAKIVSQLFALTLFEILLEKNILNWKKSFFIFIEYQALLSTAGN